jgi:alcohol dehydrogenase (cytochrome c)
MISGRNSLRLARLSVLAAAAGAILAASGRAQESGPPQRNIPTQVSPPYTQAQAELGRGLYAQHCQGCHGADLSGGSASRPLKGRPFYSHWAAGKTLQSLYKYMRASMPPGAAGTLTADDHANLVAFLLSQNALPAGAQPFPTDEAAMLSYRMPFRGDTSGGLALEMKLPPWPVAPNPADRLSQVTDQMLASPPPGEWPSWRRSVDGTGFSPLTQVSRGNVRRLQLAWSFDLPAGPNASTPLVHDGVMFVYGNGDVITALDAANGTPLWTYKHPLPKIMGPVSRVRRNMALYGDKLYFSTTASTEVALDAKTGKLIWERPNGRGTTGGPLVVNGTVIQGTTNGGSRSAGNDPGGDCLACGGGGHVLAWDAENGKLLWNFNVIPKPGEPGGDSWNGLPWDKRSGGSVWTSSYYDPTLDLVYLGTANTYDTAPLAKRSKDPKVSNDALFMNSTLAFQPRTGKLAWYYQHLANDQWDSDWVFDRQLLDLDVDGKTRRTIVTIGKLGILDALDASTGKYLFSIDAGLQNIVTRIDPATGRKSTDPALQPGGSPKLVCPHLDGAKNWTPSSLNPNSAMLFVSLTEACMQMKPIEAGETSPLSTGVAYFVAPNPKNDGRIGRLQAYDLKTRKLAWAARQRAPLTTGTLATEGGLVFAGALDRNFAAYDDETGRRLWQTRLGGVPSGAPISFSVGGKQYVAIVTGFGSLLSTGFLPLVPEIQVPDTASSAVYVFALPDD